MFKHFKNLKLIEQRIKWSVRPLWALKPARLHSDLPWGWSCIKHGVACFSIFIVPKQSFFAIWLYSLVPQSGESILANAYEIFHWCGGVCITIYRLSELQWSLNLQIKQIQSREKRARRNVLFWGLGKGLWKGIQCKHPLRPLYKPLQYHLHV